LQYNSDLSSSNWINLGNPFTATGATLNTTDSLTNAPQQFYRVVLLPKPRISQRSRRLRGSLGGA
jgi:hypothetical protein